MYEKGTVLLPTPQISVPRALMVSISSALAVPARLAASTSKAAAAHEVMAFFMGSWLLQECASCAGIGRQPRRGEIFQIEARHRAGLQVKPLALVQRFQRPAIQVKVPRAAVALDVNAVYVLRQKLDAGTTAHREFPLEPDLCAGRVRAVIEPLVDPVELLAFQRLDHCPGHMVVRQCALARVLRTRWRKARCRKQRCLLCHQFAQFGADLGQCRARRSFAFEMPAYRLHQRLGSRITALWQRQLIHRTFSWGCKKLSCAAAAQLKSTPLSLLICPSRSTSHCR